MPSTYINTSGSARLKTRARPFLTWTLRSASRSEVRIRPIFGAAATCLPAAMDSVTDLAPGQPDEHVFERDVAPGDALHVRVVSMLGYQPGRRVEAHDLAVVDDRDAVADRLR